MAIPPVADSEPNVTVTVEDTAVDHVVVNKSAAGAELTITEPDRLPQGELPEGAAVVAAVDIDVPTPAENRTGEVTFSMQWNDSMSQTLTVYHYENATQQWERLPTEVARLNDTIQITAVTGGFSPFVVVEMEGTPSTATQTQTATPTFTLTTSSSESAHASSSTAETSSSQPSRSPSMSATPERTSTSSPGFEAVVTVCVLLLLALALTRRD